MIDPQILETTPLPVLAVLALNSLGYLLKNNSPINNKHIPSILSLVGMCMFGVMGGSVKFWVIGFLLGFASSGLHGQLKEWLTPATKDK